MLVTNANVAFSCRFDGEIRTEIIKFSKNPSAQLVRTRPFFLSASGGAPVIESDVVVLVFFFVAPMMIYCRFHALFLLLVGCDNAKM